MIFSRKKAKNHQTRLDSPSKLLQFLYDPINGFESLSHAHFLDFSAPEKDLRSNHRAHNRSFSLELLS
ncbi:hypothetical protein SDJN02_27647, partial [Cucurbita argyrosperma subsp. argyrosperma]